MNSLPPLFLRKLSFLTTCAVVLFVAIPSIQAGEWTTVWGDDFTGQTGGLPPSLDFTGLGGNDFTSNPGSGTTITVDGALGNDSPSLTLSDQHVTHSALTRIYMDRFAPFTLSETTNNMDVTYDFKVDSFSTTNSNDNFRFILCFDNQPLQQLVVGFGRGDLNGDANHLAFYADATTGIGGTGGALGAVAPTAATAIGFTGSGWDSGFDFGTYNSTAGQETSNDTNGDWYRFYLDYDYTSEVSLHGYVMNLRTNEGAIFTRNMQTRLAFSNQGSSTSGIYFLSGAAMKGVSHFDNVLVETYTESVPEPSTYALMFGAMGMLAGFRCFRRRA